MWGGEGICTAGSLLMPSEVEGSRVECSCEGSTHDCTILWISNRCQAGSGMQGVSTCSLELLQRAVTDVVILDVRMPYGLISRSCKTSGEKGFDRGVNALPRVHSMMRCS